MENDTAHLGPAKEKADEPLHVYDWLDQPAADENERLAKEWLNKFSKSAYDKYKSGAGDWLAAHALTVEWRGQRYWCRGCSRLGDVWITKDPTRATHYDHRVNVGELSNWERFDDARGNLQHNACRVATGLVRQSSGTPETDAYFRGPCKNILSRRARNFARKIELERNVLINALKTIRFMARDADIKKLADDAINFLPNAIDDESPPR